MVRRSFNRRRAYPQRKRWYFNAGANLPIVGKTNVSFGSGTKKAIRSIAKQVVRNTVEPKRWNYEINNKDNFTNGTIYCFNIMENIVKGTDDVNRLGERIHLKNLLVKYNFEGDHVSNGGANTSFGRQLYFRIMLVGLKENITTAGDWSSATLGASTLFENYNIGHLMMSSVNKEKVTVFSDKKICVNTGDANKVYWTKYHTLAKTLDKSFQYDDQSTSTFSKGLNYYLVVIPYESQTASSTNLPVLNMTTTMHLNFSDTK